MWHLKPVAIFSCALVGLLSFSSCKVLPPTIRSVEQVKAERSGTTGFKVTGEAVIHNPNRVRIRVKDLNLKVDVNNKTLATIGRQDDILIKRNADFTLPLAIEVKSVESLWGDLQSLFGTLKQKEIEMGISGNIKLRAFWLLRYSFPLEKKQKIALPKIK